jgi:hypothetical protein
VAYVNAKVDDRWSLCGLNAVFLENDLLRVIVLPSLGAHIQQIIHKPSGSELLYENPRVDPSPTPFGSPWSGSLGGIDEMMPTGWESAHQGDRYPDHGEFITRPWRIDILDRGPDTARVRLTCDGFLSPVRAERIMTLRAGEPRLEMEHRISNLANEPYDFLWGLHPNFPGAARYRVDLPASRVREEHYRARFFDGTPAAEYLWPFRESDGGRTDMRGPVDGLRSALHYAEATEGWLAYTNLDRDVGMAVAFDLKVFPFIWHWIQRGRRGHYLVAPQPWTGFPVRLEEAASELGVCAHLPPAGVLETTTYWVVYRGLEAVAGVSSSGDVIPGQP